MNVDAYRDLRLLIDFSLDHAVTQRSLAKKYGFALGLTNFLIRRLVRKGYVKLVNLEQKRLRYLITPKGLAAKAQLTYQYLDYSLGLYRSMRTFLASTLSVIVQSARRDTVLIGADEVAEIAFLVLQQHRVPVIAVLEDAPAGAVRFMNQPIGSIDRLPALAYDWIVIASFTDARKVVQRLSQEGVPAHKIITIPEEERLAPPSAERVLEPKTLVEASPLCL